MRDFGTVPPGTTLYIPFATYDSNDPSASVTLTGLATSDIEIFKDGSTTQRASDAGYTLLDTDGIDFDGITGIHGLSIDLADNTTAGFYSAGSQYWVVVSSVTVDAATVNFIAATFRIGYDAAILNTTIATLSTQTSFTLTTGPAEDDALNGSIVLIHDVASAVQKGYAVVSDYTGASKTVTLTAGTTFTAAASDNISFFPPVNAQYGGAVAYSTTRGLAGTALPNAAADAAGGLPISDAGGLDLDALNSNVSAILTDTGTTLQAELDGIQADTEDIQSRLPAALGANGNLKADVRDWIGTAVATPTTNGVPEVDVTHFGGTAGNFTVGNPAVNVNLWGGQSVSLSADFHPIVDVDSFETTAKAEIQIECNDAIVANRLDELLAADSDIDGAAPPTVGSVFHELMSATAGSFTFDQTTDSLEAVRNRGDAAWTTATGFSTHSAADVVTALGTGSSLTDLATAAALTTVDDFLDTEIAAIKAKTDQLTFTNTNVVDASIQAAADIADAVGQKLAAIILRRTMANIEASASGDALSKSSLYGAVQQMQESNTSDNAGKLTIYKTDGTTELGQLTLTTDGAAEPVTGVS